MPKDKKILTGNKILDEIYKNGIKQQLYKIQEAYKAPHKKLYPNNLNFEGEKPSVIILPDGGNVAATMSAIEHARYISPGIVVFNLEKQKEITEMGKSALGNLSKLINKDNTDGL